MEVRYFDNSATTRIKEEVLNEMFPYLSKEYGNPSSLYSIGRSAKRAIEEARRRVASLINCKPEEIYFTSCGSESDNTALKGIAYSNKNKGKHIITSKIEHPAILHSCQNLENKGFEVTYLDVDKNGFVNLQSLENSIRSDTILISIMFANNEIGTIEPIEEISKIAHKNGIIFHTDAVQAAGHLHIDVKEQNIDMLSLSAHKFHGPKGIGALYAKRGIILETIINGGAQERGKRAGTENIPAIMGMAAALEEACAAMDEHSAKLTVLRERLIHGLDQIPYSELNGDHKHRLPSNVNFCFEGIEGESLLLLLDDKGICASSGSACTSGSLDPSHVLLAIGRPHEVAHGSLRLSLGEDMTEADIDEIILAVTDVVNYLRNISPFWRDLVNGKRPHIFER